MEAFLKTIPSEVDRLEVLFPVSWQAGPRTPQHLARLITPPVLPLCLCSQAGRWEQPLASRWGRA